MTDTNPYATPAATLAQPQEALVGTFVPNGKQVDAGQGIEWIKMGFRQLFAAPGPWYLGILALYGALFVAAVIPLLNFIVVFASPFMNPIILGGFFAAGEAQARTGKFTVGVVFDGFRRRTAQLLGVGALVFVASIAILGVGFVLAGGTALISAITAGNGEPPTELISKIVIAYLVVLLLFVPVMMAAWFAPPLVMFNNLGAVEALQQSFNACLKNFVPFLLYGVGGFIVLLVAMIPFGLGLLVAFPAFIAALYPIYADIFLDKTGAKRV